MEEKTKQQSEHFPDAFYRVTVKGLLVRDNKILMTLDFAGDAAKAKGGEWEMPGGGLDFGEHFRDALKREIMEEMGLQTTWIAERPLYIWTHKRLNRRGMDWHYIMALGVPFEVEHLDFTPSEECQELQFFTKDELLKLRDEGKLGDQIDSFVDMFDPNDFKNLPQ